MSDDYDENNGLLDEDPALDFILYQEMEKENKQPGSKSGCLGGMLVFIIPVGMFYIFSRIVV